MFQHHQINQQLMKCCISRNGSFNFKAITGLLVLRRWKCKPAMNADFIFWTPFFEKWCTSSFYIPSVVFYRWTIHRVGWSRIRTCNRYCVYQFRQSASRRTWDSNPHVCYQTVSGNCAIAATAYRELLRLYYSAYKTHIWFAVNRQISILPLGKLLCPHPLKGSFRRLRLRTGIY